MRTAGHDDPAIGDWRSCDRVAAERRADDSVTDVRTTALLRVAPPLADADALPLPLIAGYAERYGLHADAVRVTSRDSTSEVGTRERETWIGVTLSAADNLAALQARSPQIPLQRDR